MKKILIALLFLAINIQSCTEQDVLKEDKLSVKLTDIENNIKKGTLQLETYHNPYEEIHMDLIIGLTNIDNSADSIEIRNSIEEILFENSQRLLKSGLILKNIQKEKRTFTKDEEAIFKSYVNALKINGNYNKISIAEYFINELQKLDYISSESKDYCIYAISLHRSLMLFVDIDNTLQNKSVQSVGERWWTPCAGRDCLDCCMFRKTQAMDDWNWIDWAWFLANPPANVAVMAASCGWDCLTP